MFHCLLEGSQTSLKPNTKLLKTFYRLNFSTMLKSLEDEQKTAFRLNVRQQPNMNIIKDGLGASFKLLDYYCML